MGPAILPCPSGTVQLLCHIAPSKAVRQTVASPPTENARHLLDLQQLKGDFFRRSSHVFSSSATLKRRRNHVPFSWRVFTAAVGGEVSLEEPVTGTAVEQEFAQEDQAVEGVASNGEEPLAADSSEVTPATQQGKRNAPKRDRNIVVSAEDLKPGAVFTGKVIAIQPFGAFIDIGAFTNGLVHISRLSKAFVKAVEDVVQIGQEVTVQILEVDFDLKRISLMLKREGEEQDEEQGNRLPREGDGRGVKQQGSVARRTSLGRRNAPEPGTKLQKGQTLNGVIKNIIRSGVFVTLPEGNEGFLPASEVNSRAVNVVPETYFKLGQEVTVRVLRIEKGRVRLTMKQEVDLKKFNQSFNKDVIGMATNPFEIAFRQNEVIASYLVEKQRLQDVADGKIADEVEAVPTVSGEEETELSSEPAGEGDAANAVAVAVSEGLDVGAPVADLIDTDKEDVHAESVEEGAKEVVDKIQEDELLVASQGLTVEEETVKEVEPGDDMAVALDQPQGLTVEEAVKEVVEAQVEEAVEGVLEEAQGLAVGESVEAQVEEVVKEVAEEAQGLALGEAAVEKVVSQDLLVEEASVEKLVVEAAVEEVLVESAVEETKDKLQEDALSVAQPAVLDPLPTTNLPPM